MRRKLLPDGDPNSRDTLRNPDGTPKQDRWYGPDGRPILDRDYNHGGNNHEFPHDHDWVDGERVPPGGRPIGPVPEGLPPSAPIVPIPAIMSGTSTRSAMAWMTSALRGFVGFLPIFIPRYQFEILDPFGDQMASNNINTVDAC